MATAPILPVGQSVHSALPVPSSFVLQLQQALQAEGYAVVANGTYGPQTADALRSFQQAHPMETGIDQALATLGIKDAFGNPLYFASGATYQALGLCIDRVTCNANIWAPVLGSNEAAVAACVAVGLAADQGLISLTFPLPPDCLPAPPPPDGGLVERGKVFLPLLIVVGIALLGRGQSHG